MIKLMDLLFEVNSNKNITNSINTLVDKFGGDPEDINDGRCGDFIVELYKMFPYFKAMDTAMIWNFNNVIPPDYDFILQQQGMSNFNGYDDIPKIDYDKDYVVINKHGRNWRYNSVYLPDTMAKRLKIENYPVHIWAVYNNKFYDAECANGVSQWWNLPFFKKYLK